jgi:hypothetical protein
MSWRVIAMRLCNKAISTTEEEEKEFLTAKPPIELVQMRQERKEKHVIKKSL